MSEGQFRFLIVFVAVIVAASPLLHLAVLPALVLFAGASVEHICAAIRRQP